VDLADITLLILTYNEEANIERTLKGVHWARRILVLDSGSTDQTLGILAEHPQVQVEHRVFDNFASQCNFALEFMSTTWILSIDADYLCPPAFEQELLNLPDDVDGAEASFTYCVNGRRLRSCLYPPRVVLFRRTMGRYVADGHAHRLSTTGKIVRLSTPILHDDRKPLSRWIDDQTRYADLEVAKLQSHSRNELNWKDQLRKRILFAAPAMFLYCLIVKGLILDGWPGIYYSMQRTYAELLLAIKLLNARLRNNSTGPDNDPRLESASSVASHRYVACSLSSDAGAHIENPRH
jgi:glycosyltransferase involved in cell wall biosynthesis